MNQPERVANLVRKGLTPRQVSKKLGISLASTNQYLHRAVGEGLIRRSDVFFSIPEDRREREPELANWYDERHALGDMYQDLRRIELFLHNTVYEVLLEEYGDGELGWWRNGVPEGVRVKCQERRECDVDHPCEPFGYSDLLDLDKTIQKQWKLFGPLFGKYDKNELNRDLRQLSRIRNKVMHPVRGAIPALEDFDFVRQFDHKIHNGG